MTAAAAVLLTIIAGAFWTRLGRLVLAHVLIRASRLCHNAAGRIIEKMEARR